MTTPVPVPNFSTRRARQLPRLLLLAAAAASAAIASAPADAAGRYGGHGGYGGYHRGPVYVGHGPGYYHRGPRFGFGLGLGIGFGAAALAYPGWYGPSWYGYSYPGYVVAPPATVYYQQTPDEPEAASQPQSAPQKAPPEPIFYPRNGQSASQVETDRQDCNRWAVSVPGAVGDANVFQRATLACMDGRGYTVR